LAEEAEDTENRSPIKLALVLALALFGMVVALNLLGSPEIRISAEQFRQLKHEGAIEKITISPSGWHCGLGRVRRIADSHGEFVTQQVLLADQPEPTAAQLSEWRAAGIAIEYNLEPVAQSSGWGGMALISGLLGLGIWYLWQQVRRHRREGSPRQKLQELERELREGRLSQEEYAKKAEALWAEM